MKTIGALILLIAVGVGVWYFFGGTDQSPTNDLIRVEAPTENVEVTSPLSIRGEARGTWYFEASFPARLENAAGDLIAQGPIQADGDWMTEEFVPFDDTLAFSVATRTDAVLILSRDNPSGLPENDASISIPVTLLPSETTTVQVFFPNSELDTSDPLDCGAVFATERTIPNTTAVGTAAINELLEGPTATESAEGYATSINDGVTLQSLTIENGVAYADFSSQLDEDIGGSCLVTSIRAQIEETLLQFPTVNSVVISIDGETEEILQP